MRWSRRQSRQSAARLTPAASATARSSSRASTTLSEFVLASAETPPYESLASGGRGNRPHGKGSTTNGRQTGSRADQGKRRQVRRLPFHRSSRQVAAHGAH